MTALTHVEMATDGACKGNPGPGGWGVLLRMGKNEKELSGGDPHTTNNRMELMAVIEGLRALIRPCHVTIQTDSKYVMDGITRWITGWQANGWKTSSKQPVRNVELWHELLEVMKPHEIEWVWVKGHSGHADNDRADKLASDAAVAMMPVD